MITRIINSRLPLMVLTPVKVFDLNYFKAINDSGGLGVLDTEFLDKGLILERIKDLSGESLLFGVRVAEQDQDLIDEIKRLKVHNLDMIIASLGKDDTPADFSGFSDTKIALEVRDIDMEEKIKTIDPHVLILKGNEASGRVSKYSSFILMQWYLKHSDLPVFVQGGVGMYTASGMFAAGVSGVVLDSQLWLSDEAPVSENLKSLVSSLDENDSTQIKTDNNNIYRVFAKLGTKIVKDLKQEAVELIGKQDREPNLFEKIKEKIVALDDNEAQFIQSLFYLGQDGVFAKHFAKNTSALKEMVSQFFKGIGTNLNYIDGHDPLRRDSDLAKMHGTKYPIVQGPMANISDNSKFASKVFKAGALPFLAVGSLPNDLADNMLKDGAENLDRFGAGLVGIEAFNPAVDAHIKMVKDYKVPFALFAGGIPSQILDLENAGTKTYLHAPSVSMLKNGIKSGCKRFIFEGGEAGGHVGSLSSLVLWEVTAAHIMEEDEYDLSGLSLIFAGGISTCYAAFFISGFSSILAAKGAKVGVQVGTAYLFTPEIIETNSLKSQYQQIISDTDETVVVGETVGLLSRTAPTEFAKMMLKLEQDMIKGKDSLENRKHAFEQKNIGSLLIGAKGFLPDFKNPGEENYTYFEDEEHKEKGNFLVGDSLAFFNEQLSIDDIHSRYVDNKSLLFQNLNKLEISTSSKNKINDEIAVVGMACTLPDADSPEQLWNNILSKKYSISKIPESRLNRELYYDADKSEQDKTYTLLAGSINDYEFDGDRFGYDKEKSSKLSKSQQMILDTAYKAVENAGYLGDDDQIICKDPAKTAVIIATCLGNELGNDLLLKYYFPEVFSWVRDTEEYKNLTKKQKNELKESLKQGFEGNNPGYDPVHGLLLNIEASRVAKHLGIRGLNYVIDAACASSFAAIDAAAGELLSGEHDQVIVGGVNTHLSPETFVGFAKMGTLSAKGSFPFDDRADGFILGEGAVVFMLKRMKDAVRDNDNIIGVINSIGASSDGKGKAIAAPNPIGQKLSIERCYEKTLQDISPKDIGFIEAHGTSTIVGDEVEISTLKDKYAGANAGISSIKSQIGHLLGGSGAAGFIKALLAVNHGVLPPNCQFENLSKNCNLDDSSLFIVEDQQKWEADGKVKRASVSSYGFGGINYHALLQEFRGDYKLINRDIFSDTEYDFNDDRIVVAGLGTILGDANNKEEFWEQLQSGKTALSPVPEKVFSNKAYSDEDKGSFYWLPEVKAGIARDFEFNNIKYKMPPTVVRSVERGQLFGLMTADEAVNTSGLEKCLTRGNKAGVILGTIAGERQSKNILRVRRNFIAQLITDFSGIPIKARKAIADNVVSVIEERIPENNGDTTPGLLSNIISGRIANYFGFNGANYVVDASCASASVAMRSAAREILFKDLDFALTGGVDTNLYPAALMAFKRMGLLSEGDCNYFDSRADGYVMGEGAAMHVLTTYKKAKEADMEIYGELNEFSVKSSVPDHLLSPSGPVFASAINDSYKKSGIRKQDVSHLDLFAFSNIFGDMVEKQVVEECFDHEVYCGNAKSQFGYFRAANPAVALAKLMLMVKNNKILPGFNYSEEHSTLNDSAVLKTAGEIVTIPDNKPVRFASNVNGIGGNHMHVIAGAIPKSLEAVKMKQPAKQAEHVRLRDFSYSSDKKGQKLRMVALLSGQGAQRPGMMKELYAKDETIKTVMDRGEAIFFKQRGYSLLEMMFKDNADLNLTQNTQPAVFLSSAAIYDRLHREGFSPDYFIGHSVGEYTALYCNGMLDFDDAMNLIIKRADLMKEAGDEIPGKIMVVFKNEKEVETLIRESFVSNIYVTNKNSEKQTAVSGSEEGIAKFCEFLKEKGTAFTKLNLSGAFHTPLLRKASAKLRDHLDTIRLRDTRYGKIISNTLGKPYSERRHEVKDLLARQIVSPVEFIKSIEYVYASGRTHFIEIGPSKLLVNLLKNINIADYNTAVTVDIKKGEKTSFDTCMGYLRSYNSIFTQPAVLPEQKDKPIMNDTTEPVSKTTDMPVAMTSDKDFETFKNNNSQYIDNLLFKEYQKQKKEAAAYAFEKFNFNIEQIVISGVSLGLPGKARKVFASDNFDAIIDGKNFIEPLTSEGQDLIIDKNITKLYKQPDGSAKFVKITKAEDVIHLAGQLGYFDLTDEYGIKEQYDISMSLGIAAGIEALKDAGIPLVMQYKLSKNGKSYIPDGFALPEEMQEDTGVILTSLFPNGETLIGELENYYYEKFFLKPYEEFENIYYYLMEQVQDVTVKEELTDWFFKAKLRKKKDFNEFKFDRNFLINCCPLGSAHLAQILKAKGPNTLVSSACASTTLAIGIAEDWIRVGRCKRVIVVGGENATSEKQSQWIGSGFLSLGAATIKKRVSEAAKPFDEDRNGTILGSGAVGLIVETKEQATQRGMNGQAEILGTHIANSGFHAYNIDVPHMTKEMTKFISKVERQHGISKDEYADKLLFMSHETYTPARGGSADAEVHALESTFSKYLNDICISNTKGFTGHTLGAAIEDVVLIKALQKRKAPPIANLQKIPKHFSNLNFSSKKEINSEYGLHLAAGFGSHFAFLFVKRIQEKSFDKNPGYHAWLQKISKAQNPELKLIDNMLCVVSDGQPAIRKNKIAAEVKGQAAKEQVVSASSKETETIEVPSAPVQEMNLAATPVNHIEKIKEIIAVQTGYTTDMLEDDLDLEADLGIDTVKQVEIFGGLANQFGFSVPDDLRLRDLNTILKLSEYVSTQTGQTQEAAAPAPDSHAEETSVDDSSQAATEDVLENVRIIISEQTGYTTDMLEDDLDLEADLGIDTVKQVEIFGSLANQFGFSVPDDLRLRDLNTIAKLSDYISLQAGAKTNAPVPSANTVQEAAPVVAASQGNIENVVEDVRVIISEQTGYTTDMLEDDLDLEADLGIDTVKQVEIFGSLANKFGFSVPDDLRLRDLNTIAKLSEYIHSISAGADAVEVEIKQEEAKEVVIAEDSKQEDQFPDPTSPIKRLIVRAEETEPLEHGTRDLKDKTIIISLDSHGFAKKVIERVKAQKGKVITIGSKGADFKFDLADVKDTEKRVEEFKKKYPEIDGFIHLASLDYYFSKTDVDEAKSDKEINTTIKSFFVMIKSLFETLDRKDTIIGTITFDSVIFPYLKDLNDCGNIHPAFAGLAGLLKTVNKEMADTMVKVVDFSYKQPKKSINKITEVLLDELLSEDTRCEVGYKNKKRYILSMKPGVADKTEKIITEKDTMLVTGGAGGITYEIIKKVVEKYKTNLIILDINDIYSTDAKYLDKQADQAKLMEMLKTDMIGAKPLEIKNALDNLMRVRQSVDNIENLKSLGVSVDYNCVDVTDYKAVKQTVDKYDKIDGIFHAAGMEMSQFIPKKELRAFELVVDVKVKGMRNLLKATEGRDYKYFFTFSSVTARFGNEGQVDYTSANDLIGKTLFRQKQLNPDKIYKVYAWTAWGGVGMATNPTVKKVLEERGIQFLPMDQGVKFFMADLLDKKESEMVFSGLDYSFDKDGLLGDPSDVEFPFLDDVVEKTEKGVTYSRVLDLDRDVFLHDHTMGDVPLFLGSTGIETMAQGAKSISRDDGYFVELTDFSIPYGIKLLKGRPKELLITTDKESDDVYTCTISSQFKNPKGIAMGDPTLHYQGKYKFADKPLGKRKIEIPEFTPVKYDGDVEDLIYNPKRLFMFGLFGTITDINSFDGDKLITTVKDTSEKDFFKGSNNPNFVAAPVFVDAMFQTGGLLEFFTTNMTVLPYRIESLKIYKAVRKNAEYYCITEKVDSGEETNTYNLQLVDKKGNLYIEVKRFEMVKTSVLAKEDRIIEQIEY
jgi:malonyl CoA-acyl carrier protein transacylase